MEASERVATERAALQLSVSDRLTLIESLWESLVDEQGDDLPLSPAIVAELDRRLDEHRCDPSNTMTLAQFKELMRGRR